MNWKQLIKKSQKLNIIMTTTKILDKKTKVKTLNFILAQSLLALLDLIGVALLGLVGAISINGVQNGKSFELVLIALNFLQIYKFSFQVQVAILAILATLVLFLRTILSIHFSRKSLFFFATESASLSSHLTNLLLSSDLMFMRKRSSQETLFALSTGCNLLYVGFLANVVNLVSDIVLLLVLSFFGIVFQPTIAILLFILFIGSSLTLHFFVSKRARILGERDAKFSIAANSKILESISLFREIYVHDRSQKISADIGALRKSSAFTQAEIAFLPNISRYIVEITMLLSVLIVSAAQFILFDVSTAVATLTLFLAAGSRLVPALLRVQQGSLSIRHAFGAIGPTLEFILEIETASMRDSSKQSLTVEFGHNAKPPRVEIENLSFSYPSSNQSTLKKINLSISEGKTVALVGPSGGGKTTLVDAILGVIPPMSGRVKISSFSPREFIHTWPHAVSYVPQHVYVADVSLRDNIALGYSRDEISDDEIIRALQGAHLLELLEKLPNGLDSYLGENGSRLSGGQRQRLGIARALYTRPSMIVLDEATSSLDAESEFQIVKTIQNLKSESTIILIAHRLSTAKIADLVCYMESGQILATGTFEEVRAKVPQFEYQVNLMGL